MSEISHKLEMQAGDMMDNELKLGQLLFNYRKEHELTQEQLAKLVHPDLVKGYISSWEANKFIPSTNYMIKISELLGLPLEQLESLAVKERRSDFIDLELQNYVHTYNKFQEKYKLNTAIDIETAKLGDIKKLMEYFPITLLLDLLQGTVGMKLF